MIVAKQRGAAGNKVLIRHKGALVIRVIQTSEIACAATHLVSLALGRDLQSM